MLAYALPLFLALTSTSTALRLEQAALAKSECLALVVDICLHVEQCYRADFGDCMYRLGPGGVLDMSPSCAEAKDLQALRRRHAEIRDWACSSARRSQ